jgi:hypothetical protein
MKTILIIGLSFLSLKAFPQINESFTDGNFTSNPTWSGTNAKWNFVSTSGIFNGNTITTNTIRSIPVTGVDDTAYLSTPVMGNWGTEQTWAFWTGRIDRTFSGNNNNIFWLWANQANLISSTINGYRIRIGDASSRSILLEKVVSGTATVILSSSQSFLGDKWTGFAIRVTNINGNWTIFSSDLPLANNTGVLANVDPKNPLVTSNNMGSVNDNTFTNFDNGFLGLYTIFNHNKSEVEFDQISLTIQNFVPLPIKLISFNAIVNNNKVDLKWTTANEINVRNYVIQKSTDGNNFKDIDSVLTRGNSSTTMNYYYTDQQNNNTAPLLYYRLSMSDNDGKSQYSDIRIIRLNMQQEAKPLIAVFPNPVGNELRITIPLEWQNKDLVFEIFSSNGHLVKKTRILNSNKTETINVSTLTRGEYLVKVTCEYQTTEQKILKQ